MAGEGRSGAGGGNEESVEEGMGDRRDGREFREKKKQERTVEKV